MTFDKNYVLSRLQAGDDLDTISKELTNALNEANAEYQKQKEVDAATEKRLAAVRKLVDATMDYCAAAGFDPNDLSVDDNELALIDHMLNDTLASALHLKRVVNNLKDNNSDDEVLAKFLDELFGTTN